MGGTTSKRENTKLDCPENYPKESFQNLLSNYKKLSNVEINNLDMQNETIKQLSKLYSESNINYLKGTLIQNSVNKELELKRIRDIYCSNVNQLKTLYDKEVGNAINSFEENKNTIKDDLEKYESLTTNEKTQQLFDKLNNDGLVDFETFFEIMKDSFYENSLQ